MSEPLIFHARRDTTIFSFVAVWVVFALQFYCLFDWIECLPDQRAEWRAVLIGVSAAYTLVVLALLVVPRARTEVGAEGLRYWSVLGKGTIAWEEVEAVTLPWGGRFLPPILMLKLNRPRPKWWRPRRSEPAKFPLTSDCAGFERLFAAVLARLPEADVSEGVREYLAAPHDVAWVHRLPALLGVGAALLAVGHVFALFLEGSATGAYALVLAVAGSVGVGLPWVGGALAREWRWKPALVATLGAMVLPVGMGSVFLIIQGRSDRLLLVLAFCTAYLLATWVICLPWRPRGWHAAALYTAAFLGLLIPTSHYATREAVPCRRTGELTPGPWGLVWSPTGRAVGGFGHAGDRSGDSVFHRIDVHTLAVSSFAVRGFSFWSVMLDENRVLYRPFLPNDDDGSTRTSELALLDIRNGSCHVVLRAGALAMPPVGALSPDRLEVVFLAGPDPKNLAPRVLQINDLSVRRLDVELPPEGITGAVWRADGALLLVKGSFCTSREGELVVWTLRAGEEKPTEVLRRPRTREIRFSPDLRHALAWQADGVELLDLRTGQGRPITPPASSPGQGGRLWSPQGRVAGYAVPGRNGGRLILLDVATGRTSEAYTATDGDIVRVALSREGRYAACTVMGDLGTRIRVIEIATGRVVTLRKALSSIFLTPGSGQWSPTTATLAVMYPGNVLRPESPVAIHLLDFE